MYTSQELYECVVRSNVAFYRCFMVEIGQQRVTERICRNGKYFQRAGFFFNNKTATHYENITSHLEGTIYVLISLNM